MANRPGHVAHNRIDPLTHLLRGTFRADRHARPVSSGPVWTPTEAELARVGADGRALIDRLVSVYEFGVLEGEIVMEAAIVADRLHEVRSRREAFVPEDRSIPDKHEIAWQRALSGLLQALRARMP